MSLKAAAQEALGQLFMVGLPGPDLDPSTRTLIRARRMNNFILFRRNVEHPDRLRSLCLELADLCGQENLPPPLISIDQEGGSVARLTAPFTEFPDARDLAESPDAEDRLRDYAQTCARELLDMGVNMNLAPVLDICPKGEGYFMERRSLGDDPERVACLGKLIITELQEKGLAACAKHFPGLGAATLDPHEVLPVVSRDRRTLGVIDLVPFEAAISAGVAAVMTSHTVYADLDPERPATLSKRIFTGLLREELGYDGLVLTDDLEMGAIEGSGSVDSAALLAFQAGADVLLICHDHRKAQRAHETMVAALEKGLIAGDRLDRSLARLQKVRQRFA